MNFLLPLLLISTMVLSGTACRQQANAVAATEEQGTETTQERPVANDPQEPQGDPVIFKLERTACFGPCPAYRITIHQSGKATYEGIAHVEQQGMHHAQVDGSLMDRLVQEAEQKGFFEMKDEYDRPVTDLPSTILTVRRNGDTKTVKGRVDPPQAFKDLAAWADEMLLPIPWKPVPPQD